MKTKTVCLLGLSLLSIGFGCKSDDLGATNVAPPSKETADAQNKSIQDNPNIPQAAKDAAAARAAQMQSAGKQQADAVKNKTGG